ncbi:MAG: hypothetical protein OEU26_36705 [Candidatus Tectomicrobia bacterium]|nr:hypothetical protein [Candidatus Tectomicrobia bacterium]
MHRLLTTTLLVALGSFSLAPLSAHARSLEYVVKLAGAAVGEMRHIDTDGDGAPDKEANCFDVPLTDPNTGLTVGTGSDCLSDLEVLNENDAGCNSADSLVGCAVRLIDTTIFEFDDGTLVSQGPVSIPVVLDEVSPGAGITHITGSFPVENNILYGTGRFEGGTGSVRLSGGVDMSETVSDNEIIFDCFFALHVNR